MKKRKRIGSKERKRRQRQSERSKQGWHDEAYRKIKTRGQPRIGFLETKG